MNREEMINTEDYKSLLKEVETNSPYKRLPSPAKKWMSVSEMGELLGLKKTDRYWLVHKNYFKTKEFAGKMRINIESFEKWYANQIKYHKVNGEEPGKELKEWSYSIPELAEMLELTDGVVYDLIKRNNIDVVIADRKWITKESFQKFLDGQDEYHLDPANDYEELALEENVALADFRRKKLSQTGQRGRNGNLKYLTPDEAAFMAKVSRSMITVWYKRGYFPAVKVGANVRIKRKEFEEWLKKRNTGRSC